MAREGKNAHNHVQVELPLTHFQGKEWPDLLAQLADATNFSAFFAGSPASKSTPHLYISALSMWNQDSSIWRTWRVRFGSIPSILLPRGSITIPLLTISTACPVNSISFSPHGNRIVSGSDDKSVRVWDAKTGEQLRELQGHTGNVSSVRFSPDGNQIVSGSNDASVRVWANLNLDAPWVLAEDGWIISGAERLVWVPSTVCNVLLRPHNILILSQNGSAKISFTQCKFGPLWHECYTP